MAAHKAGILHRDLKPENVFLIERDGKRDFVKVLDFGIAKTMEAVTDRVGRLTNPGVAMGTPEYMAPEQAAGLAIDARADVYAVGAILYEMLTRAAAARGRAHHGGADAQGDGGADAAQRAPSRCAARSRVAGDAHAGDLAGAAAAVDAVDVAGAAASSPARRRRRSSRSRSPIACRATRRRTWRRACWQRRRWWA